MNYLVYLAFGGEDYYNETLFSLLSYYRHHLEGENTVVIYTDAPGFFNRQIPRPCILMPLSAIKIGELKGELDFAYRVKIKVMQNAAFNFQGNILYVDTDTVFKKNIGPLYTQLSGGGYLLDVCEGLLKSNKGGIARKMRKFLKKKDTFSHPDLEEPVQLTNSFVVWNSGCVGFNTEYVGKTIDKIEALTDALYKAYPLYLMEQIAISYFIGQKKPNAAVDYIHHYWYFKEFRQVLRQFFSYYKDAPLPLLIEKAAEIDPVEYSESKRSYKKMSFWQKQRHKLLTGRKWEVPAYKPN